MALSPLKTSCPALKCTSLPLQSGGAAGNTISNKARESGSRPKGLNPKITSDVGITLSITPSIYDRLPAKSPSDA